MKLYKYNCSICNKKSISEKSIDSCLHCDAEEINKEELTIDDYIKYIELELESANHHDYIELPNKLFNQIIKKLDLRPTEELDLAKIICEEFYKNI